MLFSTDIGRLDWRNWACRMFGGWGLLCPSWYNWLKLRLSEIIL